MKTSEVLIKAKELINTPDKWIKDQFEQVNNGSTCFCSLGALAQAAKPESEEHAQYTQMWDQNPAHMFLNLAVGRDVNFSETFATYNDTHTHDDVMMAFDKAIEMALIDEQTSLSPA